MKERFTRSTSMDRAITIRSASTRSRLSGDPSRNLWRGG
jgi:hypothetical protein